VLSLTDCLEATYARKGIGSQTVDFILTNRNRTVFFSYFAKLEGPVIVKNSNTLLSQRGFCGDR
jgi:hypothetical protein